MTYLIIQLDIFALCQKRRVEQDIYQIMKENGYLRLVGAPNGISSIFLY
jgi:hypothetical protein